MDTSLRTNLPAPRLATPAPTHGFTRVCVVGAGLVGGSLVRALLARTSVEVTVFDRDVAARVEVDAWASAESGGRVVVHEGLSSALTGVDLVVLAAPAPALPGLAAALVGLVPSTAVVTDVCSVKAGVVGALEAVLVPAGISFVGGHPMAGREVSGFQASQEELFEGCSWVLTETSHTREAHLAALAALVCDLGAARVVVTDPLAHDDAVGAVSHLPHVLASVAAACALEVDERLPGTLALAAGGFRDTTRVAAGDPALWTGIVLENAEAVTAHLDATIARLVALRDAVASADAAGVSEVLVSGALARERWSALQP